MTQEDAFLQAIIENPDDDTMRLVYADWLEEQGDPRAPAVRKHPEVCCFLYDLAHAPDAEPPLRKLEEWVFGGRADLIRGLALILGCQPCVPCPLLRLPVVAGPVLERVRRALSPRPDARKAAAVIRQLNGRPPKGSEVLDQAARIASEHGPDVLLAVLERFEQGDRFLELLACLVQEMVLRGVILDGFPAAEGIAARLKDCDHPLARLPLFLTAVEGDLRPWFPSYSGGGRSWSNPFGPSQQDDVPLPAGQIVAVVAFTEITDAASTNRIGMAVRNWEEQSNGLSEARAFLAESPIDEEAVSLGLLRTLGLACLEGADEQDIRAVRVSPRMAFAILFSAASNGGAYNHGRSGAYGRLDAWQSLAGLSGAPQDNVEVVADIADRCLWVSFYAESNWFYQVAWDLGILAVRPDRMSLAVLAATDTD